MNTQLYSNVTSILDFRVQFARSCHLVILAVAYFALTASVGLAQAPAEEATTVEEVEAGIRAAHRRLLRHPGGVGLHYRLEYHPNPTQKTFFIYKSGLDGLLNIRWPELRSKVDGQMSGIQRLEGGVLVDKIEQTVRQASFNFETFTGVSHDGDDLGQITTYRSPFSASAAYPLRFQFIAESDQYFTTGSEYTSDYWLPHALRTGGYVLVGREAVDGVPCLVVRKDGLDAIWVATHHGYVVCKREYNYGVGKPIRERVVNSKLKEIAPGIWIPMQQVQQSYVDFTPNVILETISIAITDIKVGNLSDSDIRVILPDTILRVDDQITGKMYQMNQDTNGELDLAILKAKESNLALGGSGSREVALILALATVAALLGALLVQKYRRRMTHVREQSLLRHSK